MEEILIVDGYNIIGVAKQWQLVAADDFEQARDWLIEQMAEYQGYTGIEVYVIFDAHQVPGIGKSYHRKNLHVYYTKEKETADEHIERLVRELKRIGRRIYVATSDYTEQRVIFGQGALRKSARELMVDLKKMSEQIEEEVADKYTGSVRSKLTLDPELAARLERLRRGQ